MARYDSEHEPYWGSRPVDLKSSDLPRLKAEYLVNALPAEGRVLEVGCGGGRMLHTIALHSPSLELHGVDIRPLRVSSNEFEFRQVDVDDVALPFEPGSFDAVIVCDVFEHLAEPTITLSAIRDVLRPDGELVSFTPLEDNPLSFYRLFRKILGDDLYVTTKDHKQAYSERSLVELIGARFEILDRRYVYHFLGQLMDASMFAAMKFPLVQRRLAHDNPYYVDDGGDESEDGMIAAAMRLANRLAYVESRALASTALTSAGVLFRARPR